MGLTEFLKYYRTNNSTNVTLTSMNGGKWIIPAKEYKRLYKLIRKAFATGVPVPPLTETIGKEHPLIFDFDMKYKDELKERPYTVTFLKHLCEFLWVCIGDVIDIDDESKYNDVYLMGKSKLILIKYF